MCGEVGGLVWPCLAGRARLYSLRQRGVRGLYQLRGARDLCEVRRSRPATDYGGLPQASARAVEPEGGRTWWTFCGDALQDVLLQMALECIR